MKLLPRPLRLAQHLVAAAAMLGLLALAPAPAAAQALININTASSAELQQLPGVGPARADAIIQFRDQHGPFRTVDDIQRVPGIGPATLANIRPLATVGNGDPGTAPTPQQATPDSQTSSPPQQASPPQRPGPAGRALDDIDLSEDPGTESETAAPQTIPPPQPAGANLININTATSAELQRLPGIGASRADAIIRDREQNGAYRSIDDLTRVSGIGPATLGNIRNLVTVGE